MKLETTRNSLVRVLFDHDEEIVGSPRIREIARGVYRGKGEGQIHGTGYVVESMEAALWCFFTTDTFRDAVLKAANLGDDADTTAAICGQVAGSYYGGDGIPNQWLGRLMMCQDIKRFATGLIK